MTTASLLAGSTVLLATAALFAYVGILVSQRKADGSARGALAAFAAWWFGAAVILGLGGLETLLGLAGAVDPALHTTLFYARALPISVAVGGLLYYLVFLYTGNPRWLPALAVAYLVHYLYTLYYFASLGPLEVQVTPWEVRVGATDALPSGAGAIYGAVLAIPILAATVAYARLWFRVEDTTSRYRIALVSLAFFQWFGAILIGFVAGTSAEDWFFLVYSLPGLVAATLVVAAFRPPRWMEARFGVKRSPEIRPFFKPPPVGPGASTVLPVAKEWGS